MVTKTNTHVNIWPGSRKDLIVPSPCVLGGSLVRMTLLRGRLCGLPVMGWQAVQGVSHRLVISLGPKVPQWWEGSPIPSSLLSHSPPLKTDPCLEKIIPYKILLLKKAQRKLFGIRPS